MQVAELEYMRARGLAPTEQPKGRTIPLTPQASGFQNPIGVMGYNQMVAVPFDGEKDLGEMGPIRKYMLDHNLLAMRSWQLYIDSDVCQALYTRSAMWGIGNGLKLQAEPKSVVLKSQKITLDSEEFNSFIEEYFRVYANSKMCDYKNVSTLNELAYEAWVNMEVRGDVLILMRLVDNVPTVEVIDGSNVQTPMSFGVSSGIDPINPTTNNRIKHGVEIDSRGRHVAYWVRKNTAYENINDYERIEVRMKTYPYSEMARLVYGRKYRISSTRGIPLITAIMETAAKMARYREAMLGGAEERAKVALSIEHKEYSTGENPVINQLAQATGFGPATDLPTDSMGANLANKVAATTNKMTFNLPQGASLKAVESKQELNFKEFYETNFDIVCAVAGYPPEVILSKFNANYSASRAAIKDFEHTLEVKRKAFATQFYQIIYNFCLDFWVLSDNIEIPGYREALMSQNIIALEAFRSSRWQGDVVPHIDPKKEIDAIRAMLGADSANFPLATMEQAVEMLGNGDYREVLKQYVEELTAGIGLGLEKVAPKGVPEEKEEKSEDKK